MIKRAPKVIGFVFLGLSVLLWLFVTAAFAFRPDSLAAATVIPSWLWFTAGAFSLLPAALLNWRKKLFLTKPMLGVLALWLLFTFAFTEEIRSMARGVFAASPNTAQWNEQRKSGRTLRVVSLNCAGGLAEAAAEVSAYEPDIVLLQECPKREAMEELGRQLYGDDSHLHAGLDTAILTKFPLHDVPFPHKTDQYVVAARITLSGLAEVEVMSVHLMVTPLEFSFWSPATWRAYSETRSIQRKQLDPVAEHLKRLPSDIAVLVGGDFNCPQGDGVLSSLKPELSDAFDIAGVGWGNTIINDIPVLRIDQLWSNRLLYPRRVYARKTIHSDHRLVVGEFFIERAKSH